MKCYEAALDEADAELNRVYWRLFKDLKRDTREFHGVNEETYHGLLREAQRAWIPYRDSNCAWHAGPHPGVGHTHYMAVTRCNLAMTLKRTAELKEALDDYFPPAPSPARTAWP